MGVGFHDVFLIVAGQAGDEVVGGKVYSAGLGGEWSAGHGVGSNVFVLGSGVFVLGCGVFTRRSGVSVLGSDVLVSSRGVWAAG